LRFLVKKNFFYFISLDIIKETLIKIEILDEDKVTDTLLNEMYHLEDEIKVK
jgi:hypothetical protein